jgi:two-component system, chemotaxis family, protein-glutamate methylesterase/glutaminase
LIKLLIVDDSALMRRQLNAIFQAEGDFEIRLARNGREAVEENLAFEPDVITLDINMPEMDGLTALSLLMAQRPVPVVMVSSLTEKGAMATLEALNLGAVDYIPKPGGTISLSMVEIEAEVIAKVRAAARARLKTARGLAARIRGRRHAEPRARPRSSRDATDPPCRHARRWRGPDRGLDRRPAHLGRHPARCCRRTFPGRCWSRSTCRRASPSPSPSA